MYLMVYNKANESMKKINENLQSRREFFKNAAKSALPILGAVVLAGTPILIHAAEKATGCEFGCENSCTGGCTGSCTFGCQTTCKGGCESTCKGACSNSCAHVYNQWKCRLLDYCKYGCTGDNKRQIKLKIINAERHSIASWVLKKLAKESIAFYNWYCRIE